MYIHSTKAQTPTSHPVNCLEILCVRTWCPVLQLISAQQWPTLRNESKGGAIRLIVMPMKRTHGMELQAAAARGRSKNHNTPHISCLLQKLTFKNRSMHDCQRRQLQTENQGADHSTVLAATPEGGRSADRGDIRVTLIKLVNTLTNTKTSSNKHVGTNLQLNLVHEIGRLSCLITWMTQSLYTG